MARIPNPQRPKPSDGPPPTGTRPSDAMPLPTPISVNPPKPPGMTSKQQLEAYKLLVQRAEADIKAFQRQIQSDPPRAAMYQKQLAQAQERLKKYTEQFNKQQNKVWEETGHYEEMLTGANRDAFLALKTVFNNYGLGSLAGKIFDYVKNGYSADTIGILLQDSPEYKKRFAANEARRKAGLSVLSPAEYIAAENSYRQIMKQSGLPKGFYDSTDDFAGFLGGDLSPTELQERVNLATQASVLANPAYKEALAQMGISQSEIAAYFLDNKKALPYIQKAAAKAAIGAEALSRGFEFDQRYAEELATSGISREQAAQAYARIGDEFSTLSNLGSIYGGGWTQREAEEDIFKGGGASSQKKQQLSSRERGNFSGAAGAARGGLAGKGGQR